RAASRRARRSTSRAASCRAWCCSGSSARWSSDGRQAGPERAKTVPGVSNADRFHKDPLRRWGRGAGGRGTKRLPKEGQGGRVRGGESGLGEPRGGSKLDPARAAVRSSQRTVLEVRMIKYSSFDVADLGPLAAIIPAREPEVRLALNRLPVVQGRDAIIPVCEPTLHGNEEKYLLECLRTNWISSAGRFITRFEAMFAAFCGTRYAV